MTRGDGRQQPLRTPALQNLHYRRFVQALVRREICASDRRSALVHSPVGDVAGAVSVACQASWRIAKRSGESCQPTGGSLAQSAKDPYMVRRRMKPNPGRNGRANAREGLKPTLSPTSLAAFCSFGCGALELLPRRRRQAVTGISETRATPLNSANRWQFRHLS